MIIDREVKGVALAGSAARCIKEVVVLLLGATSVARRATYPGIAGSRFQLSEFNFVILVIRWAI